MTTPTPPPAPAQPEAQPAVPKLTKKELAFVNFYLTSWNATDAARRAGYSAKSAREIARRLLTKAHIQDAIKSRVAEMAMGADEVLVRLAEHARGTIEDFLTTDGGIDLKKAKRKKRLGLVRKIKSTQRTDPEGNTTTSTEIELYDAQAALALLGRGHKLFVDRKEVTGENGGPLQVQDIEAVRKKRWEQAAPQLAEALQDE